MNSNNRFLSDNVQKEYLRQAQNGSSSATDKIIDNNFKLVCSLVQRFCGRGIDKEDLIQIGMLGLLKAIQNFDVNCNNKFSTYAVPMIMGEIKRALRDDQPIHVSRSYKETGYKIQRQREAFINEYNREPTINELAVKMEISPAAVAVALEANQRPKSLQTPLDSTSEKINELQDLLKSSDNEDNWITAMSLEETFSRLDTRLRYILIARYFREETQQQIADKLQISQVQVSRLEKQALSQMRNYLKAE